MRDASLAEIAVLIGFLLFAAAVGVVRHRLDRGLADLPPETRGYLGLDGTGGSLRRRRRALADRLTIYGLPGWVPLSEDGRRALRGVRLLMAGFMALIGVGPALWVGSAWGLVTLAPVLAVLAVRAIVVGPWREAPEGASISRRGPVEDAGQASSRG